MKRSRAVVIQRLEPRMFLSGTTHVAAPSAALTADGSGVSSDESKLKSDYAHWQAIIAADVTKLAADYGQLQKDMPAGATGHK